MIGVETCEANFTFNLPQRGAIYVQITELQKLVATYFKNRCNADEVFGCDCDFFDVPGAVLGLSVLTKMESATTLP